MKLPYEKIGYEQKEEFLREFLFLLDKVDKTEGENSAIFTKKPLIG